MWQVDEGNSGVAVFLLEVAVVRMEIGDIDPLSAAIGFGSLLVGLAALVVAVRAWRWQQMDIVALTELLANAVRASEDRARRQLLGDPSRTIDLQFDFRQAPVHDAGGAANRGRLTEVASYYQRLRPRRMVITGAPGAGKTVLAVELMMALLEGREPGDPVPVRLSASSWNLSPDSSVRPSTATQEMEVWLIAHVAETYRLPQRCAKVLVDGGKILPVVDGLDEMDATEQPGHTSRAGQALQMFNGYQRLRSKAALIVTCRSGHYEALNDDWARVEDSARVEIRPVSRSRTREFIIARAVSAERWRGVLDIIKRDRSAPLALGLNTPWRLTLALAVYEQRSSGGFLRDPSDLADARLDSPDAVRDHLLELFIPAALRGAGSVRLDPDQAHRWLAVLARYLNHNTATDRHLGGRQLSGTDIVLHDLWPLGGFWRPRIAPALLVLVCLVALPTTLSQVAIVDTSRVVFGASMPVVGVMHQTYLRLLTIWTRPHRISLARLRTPRGLREFSRGFLGGFLLGSFGGVGGWLGHGPRTGLLLMLILGLVVGVVGGFAYAALDAAELGMPDPRSIVRGDLVAGLVYGAAIGLMISLMFAPLLGTVVGLIFGLVFGIAFGSILGSPGLRYIGLLLSTRRRDERWLPWKLGKFLDECYRAGILRIAGTGYQFRHRELQDYLADNPLSTDIQSSKEVQRA